MSKAITCLSGRKCELAQQYAANILDCERRGDYAGKVQGWRADLSDIVHVWDWDAAAGRHVSRYLRPDGSLAERLGDVVAAWAGIRFEDRPQKVSGRNPKTGDRVLLAPAERIAVYA